MSARTTDDLLHALGRRSSSPLTDSNRRPPPYHEREEGVDPSGFARSGAGSCASLVAARRRVLHGRATLVRPQDQPGVRLASLIHSCSSGCCVSSRVVTLM